MVNRLPVLYLSCETKALGGAKAQSSLRRLVPKGVVVNDVALDLGTVTNLLADTEYFSKANVQACREKNTQPSLVVARDRHYLSVFDRSAPDDPSPFTDDPVIQMKYQLTTQTGRALYALRKQTVEPVFGITKQVMGLRQFSMGGLEKVAGEWTLATLAWNVKRMNVLKIGAVRAFLPAQGFIGRTSKCHRGQPGLSDDH
ncbi:transposase [Marinobacter sp. JB05H06]|nr:transposase [Marinobacter sp. JB05H06]